MDQGEQMIQFSKDIKPILEERAILCAKREKLLNTFLALKEKTDDTNRMSTLEEIGEDIIRQNKAHKAFMELEDEFRIFDRDLFRKVCSMNQDQIDLMKYMAEDEGCEDGLPGKSTDEIEGTMQSKIQYFRQAMRKIQRNAIVAHGVNGGSGDDWYWHEKRGMAFDKLLEEMKEMGRELEDALSVAETFRRKHLIR